jgi:ATP-dependent DNA ligase
VIAKQLDAIYKPGQRKGMVKIKRVRTIDCVVMGWRPGKHEGTVGSLIRASTRRASCARSVTPPA